MPRKEVRRNDRYVEASLNRWFNVLWLAHDQPDRAGADLDRKLWTAPAEGRYHLQHFLELRARVELALYRGEGASQGSWARPGLDAAERSMLLRIQIARALVCDSPILLMDEPFAALDAQTRSTLQDELIGIWQATGRTFLFITHDIGESILLADRIGIMTAGPAAGMKVIVPVDLPRPRRRSDPAFGALYERLNVVVSEEVRARR